jgi:hypothetical protein
MFEVNSFICKRKGPASHVSLDSTIRSQTGLVPQTLEDKVLGHENQCNGFGNAGLSKQCCLLLKHIQADDNIFSH